MGYGTIRVWLIALALLWLAFFAATALYIILAGPVQPEILGEADEEEEPPEVAGEVITVTAEEGWHTQEQASRGEEAYNQHCARCHGIDLAGIGANPPLIGEGFLTRWDTVGGLFEYTRSTMPLDNPGALEDDTYIDTIAFILQENDFPAGDEELPLDTAQLGQLALTPEHAEEEPEEELEVDEEPEEEPQEPEVEEEPETEDVEEEPEEKEPETEETTLEPAESVPAAAADLEEEDVTRGRPAGVQEPESILSPEEPEPEEDGEAASITGV